MPITPTRWPRPGVVAIAIAGAVALVATVLSAVFFSASATAANACSNPILASNLNGWGALDGATVTRDQVGDLAGVNYAFDTSGHSFYLPQLSVTAGQTWKFSAVDRVVFGSGSAKMTIEWYNSAGTYLSEISGSSVALPQSSATGGSPPTAYWTPVTVTATVPAGAVSAHVLQAGTFMPATGTDFKSTQCTYELTSASSPSPSSTSTSTSAAVVNGWGAPNATYSDEYNGTSVDLTKWALFGASPGQSTGCALGYNDHGQRCASQDTEGGGYLTVTSTANGVTGGLSGRHDFTYGRIEVRERAYPTASNGGQEYHAVPLLWPLNDDYTHGEIDFAERNVADASVGLFVHHDGTQTAHSFTVNSQEFHNYAIDWEPTFVKWYVDGVLIWTVNASISMSHFSNGGAQMDMFPATGTLMRPAKEDVDWIRMYPVSATTYQ